ncbi:multicopper oxidase family protein [Gynuella sunshinyii]|uniref:Putative multicopper oxidase n=1 Tax=Gynuella sunshinyii YC6258 TaxID=1445510 RepID=A0A0C5VIK8_9GAMM|nr:multicopper oxidase family protein [Gynuella sunshinyii]AJQ94101.1 putative multicopper oxidase [Gynuella sunshinyii YC6258]
MINRRDFLGSMLSTVVVAGTVGFPRFSLAASGSDDPYDYVLTAEPADISLVPGGVTHALCFDGGYPAPIIRGRQGKTLRILFKNRLNEPTTIHWHGLRIPIEMDGVPFLSQPPIAAGEDFLYEFVPPDAGTFWYHPHVNSMIQLGKGLVGAIIIDEAEAVDFDHEEVLLLKNWHVNEDGSFSEFTSPRNAARMGTPGRWETVNGQHKPTFPVPANALTRIRLLNVDNTLIYNIAIPDHSAWVVAIDGSPVNEPYPLQVHPMGPGMRLDLAVVTPAAGESVRIKNAKGRLMFDLVDFQVEASAFKRQAGPVKSLPANPIPKPDLGHAETVNFVFEWEGAISPADKDGNSDPKFWTINRRAWDKMTADYIPDPVARLTLGKSYIFNLRNNTPNSHPIHLHGFIWIVLNSNKKDIVPFHTDTVLLEKNETVQVAFVADNPGRWMYHCHVIEHMKTGLMGYIEVA